MQIGLIGMSGVGKSFWAERLVAAGYDCLHCDDMIAARLRDELGESLSTVHDMGDWMGFPFEAGYAEREQKYLQYEVEVLEGVAAHLAQATAPQKNFVVDMTGSAIYAGRELFQKLRQYLKIVYLAVPPNAYQRMLREYVQHPRPLIWQGLFRQGRDEDPNLALARSYPVLLAYRTNLYEAYCDVKIEYHIHRKPGFGVNDFLHYINGRGMACQS